MVIKYPLTREAQEAAQKIVERWDPNKKQLYDGSEWKLGDMQSLKDLPLDRLGLEGKYAASLMELNYFHLIKLQISPPTEGTYQVTLLLLQELRDAVESNFTVSEYSLKNWE